MRSNIMNKNCVLLESPGASPQLTLITTNLADLLKPAVHVPHSPFDARYRDAYAQKALPLEQEKLLPGFYRILYKAI